jgi:type II secretory pathway pseudopilin PulG
MEVIVSIAVVGVVLSLALPALARVRESAVTTACLSNLRQSGTFVVTFAQANQDVFPSGDYILGSLDAGTPRSSFEFPGPFRPMVVFDTFDQSTFWPAIVSGVEPLEAVSCAGIHGTSARYVPPASGHSVFGSLSTYHLSSVFYTAPELWRSGADIRESMVATRRVHDVLFPSRKSMLHEASGAHASREVTPHDRRGTNARFPVAFVDGHIELVGAANVAMPDHGNPITHSTPAPFAHTYMGAHGWDVE